jgi:hypothetical protein
MECHPPLGDDTNTSNLGVVRVLKRPRTESHTTQLVEQERATGDVNGNSSTLGSSITLYRFFQQLFLTIDFQDIENIDPTELKRQKTRERYASMTEQKAHRNAKRRASYQRKKAES